MKIQTDMEPIEFDPNHYLIEYSNEIACSCGKTWPKDYLGYRGWAAHSTAYTINRRWRKPEPPGRCMAAALVGDQSLPPEFFNTRCAWGEGHIGAHAFVTQIVDGVEMAWLSFRDEDAA